jgi:hypothetical protein
MWGGMHVWGPNDAILSFLMAFAEVVVKLVEQ